MKQIIQLLILTSQFSLSALIILCPIFLTDYQIDISIASIYTFLFLSAGSFIGGITTDRIGRQLTLFATIIFIFLGAIILQYNLYAGMAIAGFGIGPANSISFVIISETYKKREVLCVVVLCGWAIGEILLGTIFMFEPEMHTFITCFLMVPAMVISVLTFIFIEETPIYKSNPSGPASTISWKSFFLLKQSMKQLILGCILMFTLQMFYYRTQFTLDRFGISLTLNTIIVGVCQLITNIVCIFIIPKVKRKPSLIIVLAIMTGLFILLNLMRNKIVQTTIQGLMRIFDCFVMAVLAVYLPQLFSVQNRGRGTNFVMSFGVIGGGLSPLILQNMPWWGLLMFNVASICAAVFLRETFNSNSLNHQNQQLVLDQQKTKDGDMVQSLLK